MAIAEIPSPTVSADFGHWLAGFIDGEGCFVIEPNSNSRSRAYYCHVRIQLRDDDAAILEEIRARTGCGRLYRRTDGGSKPRLAWYCYTRQDCMTMVGNLDAYPPRAKKARDYAIWREAVIAWGGVSRRGNSAAARVNQPVWDRMAELREALVAGRAYRHLSASA